MGGDDELTFGQKAALKWAGFKKFMYNKEAGTVMGRNGKAWAQLIGFYFVFYCSLAAFWAAMLTIFLQTVDPLQPTWNSYVSTPALAHIPSFKNGKIEYDLPWKSGSKEADKFTDPMLKIWWKLAPENQTDEVYVEDCPDTINTEKDQRFCQYLQKELGDVCVPPHFGYDLGTPCLFVNLNKVWGWEPQPFAEGEEPEGVIVEKNRIPITCEGEDSEDDEHILNITVTPSDGISYGYFPYRLGIDQDQQKLYINPIVAIQFNITLNQKVRIVCRPHAGNLKPLPGIFNSDQPVEFVTEFKITSKE